jgi:uncharacterized membrane protein YfcA
MNTLAWYVVLGTLAGGGLVQGLSGFAFGLVAMTVWVWVVSPQVAGPLVVFGSLVGQLVSIRAFRSHFDGRRISPPVLGGCIGTPIGVVATTSKTVFKLTVGLVLLVYCPLMLCLRAVPHISVGGRWADGSVGLIGGMMGGLGGLNEPAPTLWCWLRGWSRHERRAVFQAFSLSMQSLTLTMYCATGLITRETLSLFALVAPAMILPTLLGVRLYARFSEAGFRRLILILLSLSGIVLLAASMRRLLLG